MKRLFMIRTHPGVGGVYYFANKMEAKVARDEVGVYLFVTYGPDHWKFNKGN